MKARIECGDCRGTFDGTNSGWARHYRTARHQATVKPEHRLPQQQNPEATR
jgi:hypothetical protein